MKPKHVRLPSVDEQGCPYGYTTGGAHPSCPACQQGRCVQRVTLLRNYRGEPRYLIVHQAQREGLNG